jgi:transcriptional antiterminator RfaH
MTEPYWAVAQTIATREDAIADRLDRIGYKVLAPKGRFRVDGKPARVMPVFPGYVFLHIIAGRWYDAKWTIGVLRLIMNGEQPAHLPDFEVDKIQRATGSNGLVKIPKSPRVPPTTLIADGANVRILTGSFRGFHAIYEGMDEQQRQRVLLDLFGRSTRVSLAPDDRLQLVVDDDKPAAQSGLSKSSFGIM